MSTRITLSKILSTAAIMIFLSSCSVKKTGYVDMFQLVQEFELQKEYSKEAKKEMDIKRSIIDSMIYTERVKSEAAGEALKNELYTAYQIKVEERNAEIEKMIWKRLNPLVADYGKENGYAYIYGANGTGNVLYADDEENITEALIEYVNKRYHGKD